MRDESRSGVPVAGILELFFRETKEKGAVYSR